MERRSEPRFKTCQLIPLTILGDSGLLLTAIAVEVSARGMRIVLDRPIPVGAAVKLESDDTLMLGEISYCRPESNGFVAGLRLDQVLRKSSQLETLNRALFGEERGPIVTSAVVSD